MVERGTVKEESGCTVRSSEITVRGRQRQPAVSAEELPELTSECHAMAIPRIELYCMGECVYVFNAWLEQNSMSRPAVARAREREKKVISHETKQITSYTTLRSRSVILFALCLATRRV